MEKTALQQAIESITQSKEMLEKQLKVEKNDTARAMLNMAINSTENTLQLLESLLQTDKKQILSAHTEGFNKSKQITYTWLKPYVSDAKITSKYPLPESENYFKSTYINTAQPNK